MANQELYKLENAVRKAESAWDRQMKRDGHLKKESRDISNCDASRMSPTARAFYHEYANAKQLLDAEAERSDLFGHTPANPGSYAEDAAQGKGAPDLKVVTGNYPRPDEVITPQDMPRRIVAPEVLGDWRKLSASESLGKDKPTAKVIPLDDQHFVVVEVSDHYVVLNRVIPHDQYEGNTIENLKDREPGDWDGLVFKSGPGKSPSFVMLNAAQAIACVAGDPLANVALS